MPVRSSLKPGLYKDSVALMRVAEALQARPGISRASLMMGTDANKAILAEAGLLDAALKAAKPDDLMIAVEGKAGALDGAMAAAESELAGAAAPSGPRAIGRIAPRSIAMALGAGTKADLALISVPGPYAGAEALKAVGAGLDVLLFSDNVPVEQEIAVKQAARAAGRLVMGPDCGTALIDGRPLGFANVVPRGRIGLVAASGTGLQEVMCRIAAAGEGISQAYGTGGRDLSEAVGGIAMLTALERLGRDPDTRVMVMISKPPTASVADTVLTAARATGKKLVVLFLGARPDLPGIGHVAATLEEAASAAVALARGRSTRALKPAPAPALPEASRLARRQRFMRALFSGGTFAAETQHILATAGIACRSNVPIDKRLALKDPHTSVGHSVIDLGEDAFTVGRPHPMIDHGQRIDRLAREARDPEVALILLDVVLGHGSHADPASVLAPAIAGAKKAAKRAGRVLPVLGFVTGTAGDTQGLDRQRAALKAAGMVLAPTSAAAARAAAKLLARR